jgi:hypothetical protein
LLHAVGNGFEHRLWIDVVLKHLPQLKNLVQLLDTAVQAFAAISVLQIAQIVAIAQRGFRRQREQEGRGAAVKVIGLAVIQVDNADARSS